MIKRTFKVPNGTHEVELAYANSAAPLLDPNDTASSPALIGDKLVRRLAGASAWYQATNGFTSPYSRHTHRGPLVTGQYVYWPLVGEVGVFLHMAGDHSGRPANAVIVTVDRPMLLDSLVRGSTAWLGYGIDRVGLTVRNVSAHRLEVWPADLDESEKS